MTGTSGETTNTISTIGDIPEVANYLRRIGARSRSLKSAVVEEGVGRYERIIHTINFTKDGDVISPPGLEPTDGERAAILAAVPTYQFPSPIRLTALTNLPDSLRNTPRKNLFEFKDEDGKYIMLQQRVETDEGKRYVPWTYWSDGRWRMAEPDEELPLWGLWQLKEHKVIFIHEGAKAASHIVDQIEGRVPVDNPWFEEIRHAAHIGWIGGAPNPNRTDWGPLRRAALARATIVSDNDDEGRRAVPKISEKLRCATFHLQLDNTFKEGFDLGDTFPEDKYEVSGSERVYKGPNFTECLHPATWATDEFEVPNNTGRGVRIIHRIRPHFANQWLWVENVDSFVSVDFPDIMLRRDIFNSSLRSFSHARDTAGLLLIDFTGRNAALTYRPDTQKRILIDNGKASVNLYRPPTIKPKKGDIGPWIEFLKYVFPKEEELRHILRWSATLIGHPEFRMSHGLLLLSETQGIGKTTLGAILAECVGRHNVSFPGEAMIVNPNFNGWLANRRLIVVNEIYSGHSWKAYHTLKSSVTDDFIEVNIKHQATYTIPNKTHYVLCSNSNTALKIEDKDRRWYVPQVASVPWPKEKFVKLRRWLNGDGHAIIMQWAIEYNDLVQPGEIAPMTDSKRLLIEDSRSEEEVLVLSLGETMMSLPGPVVCMLPWIKDWTKERVGKTYENERRLGAVMRGAGVFVTEEFIPYKGKKYRMATNRPEILEEDPDREARIQAASEHPRNLMGEPM